MAEEFSASHFASSYICWTQQTEGLAALYAGTRDIRYRDLCVAISARIERKPADHVHGYLCSLRGTLALYNATGDESHLQRVEAAWQEVMHCGDMLIQEVCQKHGPLKRSVLKGVRSAIGYGLILPYGT